MLLKGLTMTLATRSSLMTPQQEQTPTQVQTRQGDHMEWIRDARRMGEAIEREVQSSKERLARRTETNRQTKKTDRYA